MCSAFVQLGDYSSAIDACEKALHLDPDFQRAQDSLNRAGSR